MTKRILLTFMLFISIATIGRADSLILKSGEVLRGKIVDQNDRAYYFLLDSGGDKVEVPVSKVSIADIAPRPDGEAPKGSLIVFAKAGEDLTPMPVQSEQTYRPVSESPITNVSGLLKSKLDILAKAKETVAESNARSEAAQKQLNELKDIANAANS